MKEFPYCALDRYLTEDPRDDNEEDWDPSDDEEPEEAQLDSFIRARQAADIPENPFEFPF